MHPDLRYRLLLYNQLYRIGCGKYLCMPCAKVYIVLNINVIMGTTLVCKVCSHELKEHYRKIMCRCPCLPCQVEGCECNRVWS